MNGLRIAMILAAAALGGCGTEPIYRPTRGGYLGSAISDRSTWALSGTLSEASLAADNSLATAARSGEHSTGAELVIDLNALCVFQMVILDHGAAQQGHCRQVSVATSMDGTNWVDRHAGPGTRRVTVLSMPLAVMARYVRLRALAGDDQPWTIAEVYLQ